MREFQIGFKKMKLIQGKMLDYPSLFKKANFFKKYKHFLEIKILADTQEDFNLWKGHIETRLKKLTKFLEEPRYF